MYSPSHSFIVWAACLFLSDAASITTLSTTARQEQETPTTDAPRCDGCLLQARLPSTLTYDTTSQPLQVTIVTQTVVRNTWLIDVGTSTSTSYSLETKEITTTVPASATSDGITRAASDITWTWNGATLTWPTTYYVYTSIEADFNEFPMWGNDGELLCISSPTAIALPSPTAWESLVYPSQEPLSEYMSVPPGLVDYLAQGLTDVDPSKCTIQPGSAGNNALPSQTPLNKRSKPIRGRNPYQDRAVTADPPFPTLQVRQDGPDRANSSAISAPESSFAPGNSQHITVRQLTQVTRDGSSFHSSRPSAEDPVTSTSPAPVQAPDPTEDAQNKPTHDVQQNKATAPPIDEEPGTNTADTPEPSGKPGLGQIIESVVGALRPTSVPSKDADESTPEAQMAENVHDDSGSPQPAQTAAPDQGPTAAAEKGVTHGSSPPSAAPALLTVGTHVFTASSMSGTPHFVLDPESTLVAGGAAMTVGGTTLSLNSAGNTVVINGATQGIAAASVTPAPVLTIGDNAITADMVGGSTEFSVAPGTVLKPGDALTLSGTTYSLPSSGNIVVVNGATSTLGGIISSAPTTAPVLAIGDQPVTATVIDGTTQYILHPGTALQPGGNALTISGTTYSLPSSGNIVVVNGATSTLGGTSPPTAAPVLTIGDQPVTATVIDGTTQYVVQPGATLTQGGILVLSGTTYSLPASNPAVAIINGATSTIGPANILTIDGTTYTPKTEGSSTYYVVDGVTLAPGRVVTVDGTTLSLAAPGSVLVVDGETSTIDAGSTTVATSKTTGLGDFVASGIGATSKAAAGQRVAAPEGWWLGAVYMIGTFL